MLPNLKSSFQIIIAFCILLLINTALTGPVTNLVQDCVLPNDLRDEILLYSEKVNQIIDSATNGEFKNVTWNELVKFVDKFGNRLVGTENLENAIDYMIQLSKDSGLDVTTEQVQVPQWVRGNESATLLQPRNRNLRMLGLGYSIGTPPEGITAEALVVKSFDELTANANLAKGKIVVYNEEWTGYGSTVQYRGRGASEASRVGAVASLIRSATPFSMDTPHTGMQSYASDVTPIPTACITVEDAHMLQRMQDRGETIKILLKMDAQMVGNSTSRNTVVELKGSENPEKIVIVSGHIDSWDVGQGAMDDGGGVFISWAALALLKRLNFQPKRTIRAIYWTGEEMGLLGALAYEKAHRKETDNIIFIMESDIGTFNPIGIEYSAGELGGCILQEIMELLAPINATGARPSSDVGSDITLWTGRGFPGASLDTENEKYFWYHHTEADNIEVEDSGVLDKNTALWATVAYTIADISIDFPRELPIKKKN